MSSTVPLWVALVGPAATILVTAITLWFTNRRETQRQGHELRLKEKELEAERNSARIARLRDERIAAYRKLHAATIKQPMQDEEVERVWQAFNEVQLLAESSDLLFYAEAVWLNYSDAHSEYRTVNMGKALEAWDEVKKNQKLFLKHAREELGISTSAVTEGPPH